MARELSQQGVRLHPPSQRRVRVRNLAEARVGRETLIGEAHHVLFEGRRDRFRQRDLPPVAWESIAAALTAWVPRSPGAATRRWKNADSSSRPRAGRLFRGERHAAAGERLGAKARARAPMIPTWDGTAERSAPWAAHRALGQAAPVLLVARGGQHRHRTRPRRRSGRAAARLRCSRRPGSRSPRRPRRGEPSPSPRRGRRARSGAHSRQPAPPPVTRQGWLAGTWRHGERANRPGAARPRRQPQPLQGRRGNERFAPRDGRSAGRREARPSGSPGQRCPRRRRSRGT